MGVSRSGWTPRDVYDIINAEIIGQEAAKRAASLIIYNAMEGRRSHAVFAGQTGSGKSEIWRVLADAFPGAVHMYDANAITATGYNAQGAIHFSDIFQEIARYNAAFHIVVIDEADKAYFSHRVGSGGTDWNRVQQEQMLKMLDGDVVAYTTGSKGEEAYGFDCSCLSFVFLGAFSDIFAARSKCSSIGFSTTPKADPSGPVTREELLQAGMMPEIMGRISRVVTMDMPDMDTMRMIGRKTVKRLENEYNARIIVHSDIFGDICRGALSAGLGARYIRSELMALLDAAQFEDPESNEYIIDVPHKNEERTVTT